MAGLSATKPGHQFPSWRTFNKIHMPICVHSGNLFGKKMYKEINRLVLHSSEAVNSLLWTGVVVHT